MLSEVEMPVSGMDSPTEKVNDHPDMLGTARRRWRLSTRGEASAAGEAREPLFGRSGLSKAQARQWVSLTATIPGPGKTNVRLRDKVPILDHRVAIPDSHCTEHPPKFPVTKSKSGHSGKEVVEMNPCCGLAAVGSSGGGRSEEEDEHGRGRRQDAALGRR